MWFAAVEITAVAKTPSVVADPIGDEHRPMFKPNIWPWLAGIFLSLIAVLGAPEAQAVPITVNVTHTFGLNVNPQAGETIGGVWTRTLNVDACGQTGSLSTFCAATANSGFYFFPPSPLPSGTTFSASTSAPPPPPGTASATASTTTTVNANGTGSNSVTATVDTTFGRESARADASSSLALQIGVSNSAGLITWKPQFLVDTVNASAARARGRDPISITILNLDTGGTQSSELFSMDVGINGPGSASWQNGSFSLSGTDSGTDGFFSIVMDSPFITTGTGILFAEFAGGVITQSNDTGVFDGLLPGVGASANDINFSFGDANNNIPIGFDFGGTSTRGFQLTADLRTGGCASLNGPPDCAAIIPEPSTLLLLGTGLVGLFGYAWRRRMQRTENGVRPLLCSIS